MSQTVSGTLAVTLTTIENVPLGSGINNTIIGQLNNSFASGSGSAQCQWHYEDLGRVLTAGSNQTYTLSALVDTLGRTVALTSVRYLLLIVMARTAGDYLVLGNAALHAWGPMFDTSTDTLKIFDVFLLPAFLTDGYAVASGSSDQLKIHNGGSNSITYNLYVAGV
jgi:hypothetical protein